MRKKSLPKAKLMISVESQKGTDRIRTVSVYDLRTHKYWTSEQISERGIIWFLNINDLKETLNWNLNGDSLKYQFRWIRSLRDRSEGVAYIFD